MARNAVQSRTTKPLPLNPRSARSSAMEIGRQKLDKTAPLCSGIWRPGAERQFVLEIYNVVAQRVQRQIFQPQRGRQHRPQSLRSLTRHRRVEHRSDITGQCLRGLLLWRRDQRAHQIVCATIHFFYLISCADSVSCVRASAPDGHGGYTFTLLMTDISSLRGTGTKATAVFMDEFFFFNPKAFASIFPVTATGAMLVMTSSLSPGAQTSAMRILDVTYDDGTPVVKKLNWVQACVECRRKGTPEKCHHIARPPQHFQSWGSQARLSKLLSVDPAAYDREVLNITDDPSIVPAFQSEWIDSMLSTAQSLQALALTSLSPLTPLVAATGISTHWSLCFHPGSLYRMSGAHRYSPHHRSVASCTNSSIVSAPARKASPSGANAFST